MQSMGNLFSFLFIIGLYGIGVWITVKFYLALARIGEELSEINMVLRQRLPRPDERPNP